MSISSIKKTAKELIRNEIGILFLLMFVALFLTSASQIVFSIVPVIGNIASAVIVASAFSLSGYRIYLNLTKNIKPEFSALFSGFDDFWTMFKVNLLISIFTYLWSLLFIIPGIVKSYSYAMAPYIAAENKGISSFEAIDRSREMMDGNKMKLFLLELSFFGWHILAPFTLGLLYIWLTPYIQASRTVFYNSLKDSTSKDEEVVTGSFSEASTDSSDTSGGASETPGTKGTENSSAGENPKPSMEDLPNIDNIL